MCQANVGKILAGATTAADDAQMMSVLFPATLLNILDLIGVAVELM